MTVMLERPVPVEPEVLPPIDIAALKRASAVGTGAALLDDIRPGWESEISLESLDLSDSLNCVLGQLYGSYHAALIHVFPHAPRNMVDAVVSHGFDDTLWDCNKLTGLWKDVILAKRAQKIAA